jgi:hypothetical protein
MITIQSASSPWQCYRPSQAATQLQIWQTNVSAKFAVMRNCCTAINTCTAQVPWFADLATAGCTAAGVTTDGHLSLTATSSSSSSSSRTAVEPGISQQLEPSTAPQLSILAATTIAQLALQHSEAATASTTSSYNEDTAAAAAAAAAAATTAAAAEAPAHVLLHHLMPQLLSCLAPYKPASFSSHWASTLVTAASQLYHSHCPHAAGLSGLCLQYLQERFGFSSSSSSSSSKLRAGGVAARAKLCLGDAACMSLLAALLSKPQQQLRLRSGTPQQQQQQQQQQQATLDVDLLQDLVACALQGLCNTGDTEGRECTHTMASTACICHPQLSRCITAAALFEVLRRAFVHQHHMQTSALQSDVKLLLLLLLTTQHMYCHALQVETYSLSCKPCCCSL